MIRLLSRILFAALWIPVIGMTQTAAQTAAAQTGKLAWLNVDSAVLSCDEGKKEFGEIQKFVEEKNADLEAMKKEFDSLQNQLNVQGDKLTDEARADLEYQISVKETQLQRFQQDTQKEINNKRDRAYSYILKRLQRVIDKVAREKGLTAVFFINPNRDAWFDSTLDITEEMVKAYNATYPVSEAKTPASSPAAP